MAAIRAAGGAVDYDWQWGDDKPEIIWGDRWWQAPQWLAGLVPVDYVANIIHVSLVPSRANKKADDETLAQVGHLKHVENLWLNGTAITDAGLGISRAWLACEHSGSITPSSAMPAWLTSGG